MASLHKSSLGHHHHPLSCNPGFRFDQFYLLLTVFFCSGVSSRTRYRSRQVDSSTDMSLPDPRPVVAPRRRRQPARQPGPAPPQPPQPDPCDGNLLLAQFTPNHLRYMDLPGPGPAGPRPAQQPLEPEQVPNHLLARYSPNHMRYLD